MVRRLLGFVLAFLLLVPGFAQESLSQNITSLEDYIISMENNSIRQEEIIQNLTEDLNQSEMKLQNLENLQTETLKQLEMQSSLLKKSEEKCFRWKLTAGISIGVSITSIGILIWKLSK